ncbi:response regulator [candidate division KSB1 bacterium]|nr:response regulator [candidate division KSB1 bacterium]
MTHNTEKQRYTVLIIDQQTQVAKLYSLLQSKSCQVHVLDTGQKAFEYCLQNPPTVIITEYNLPDQPGISFINQIKSHHITQHIPIIVISQELDLEKRIELLNLEIDDFVLKPCLPEEIIARTEIILQELEVIVESQKNLDHGFMGRLDEMNLVDIVQTLELGHKSGIIHLTRGGIIGKVMIRDGQIMTAAVNGKKPSDALNSLFTWLDGHFWVTLQDVSYPNEIQATNKSLLQIASDSIQKYRQIIAHLPSLKSILKAVPTESVFKVSKEEKHVLKLFRVPHSILHVLEQSRLPEIIILKNIKILLDKGLLIPAGQNAAHEDDPIGQVISSQDFDDSDVYSKIAAFFKTDQNNDKNKIVNNQGNGRLKVTDLKISHRFALSKGDIICIRQKLNSL